MREEEIVITGRGKQFFRGNFELHLQHCDERIVERWHFFDSVFARTQQAYNSLPMVKAVETKAEMKVNVSILQLSEE